MQKIIPIILMLSLGACSSPKNKHNDIAIHESQNLPLWVTETGTYCQNKDMICAVGEGSTYAEADVGAEVALAATFETKISSKTKIESSYLTEEEKNEFYEVVTEDVEQGVDGILKGAQISERYKVDGLYYSLGTLNKTKTADLLGIEIKALDDQLQHLMEKRKKSLIGKMLYLFGQRELYNEKLILVTGKGIKSKISVNKIDGIKDSNIKLKVFLEVDVNLNETLRQKIESMFLSMGYQIVQDRACDYVVTIENKITKEYLNVSGFEKYQFALTILAKDNFNKTLGSHVVQEVVTARSMQDAYLKVDPVLVKSVEENFDLLNLD